MGTLSQRGKTAGHRHPLLESIGPAIVMAGAAIGGSHLLAATAAGARYGFSLLGIVLLINLLKYPFFEFAQRYTAVTGESVLVGYRRLGRWELYAFLLLNLISSIANIAGVALISGMLAAELFGIALTPFVWTAIALGTCTAIMVLGQYKWLDKLMKVQVMLLAVATLVALSAALHHALGSAVEPSVEAPAIWDKAGILFLVALMGWMPAPIEISAWASLWMGERRAETGHAPTLREARVDFHLGYLSTSFLAVAFLSLGALVVFRAGEPLQTGGAFAKQLIALYTSTLGTWIRPIIATVAFVTMFSTTLTCMDGYPRAVAASFTELIPRLRGRFQRTYLVMLLLIVTAALVLVFFSHQSIKKMLDVVMVLSFLAAPVFAVINYRIVTADFMPESGRPGPVLRGLSWVGIIFLVGFSLLFLFTRFVW